MRDAFAAELLKLAHKDHNIELLTGDLGFGVLRPFKTELPDQFHNVGIAEQL
jgi:transketolase